MNRSVSLYLLAIMPAIAPALHAQQYPSRPIRIIIPFPPGDSLDTMSRLISPKLPWIPAWRGNDVLSSGSVCSFVETGVSQ
jgi:tripartite-type tricarboxylate transporter receptor subunit TctC